MLKVEGISAGYGRVPVLDGVSLQLEPGELVTVFGANGAGKTTLLKTLAGFIKPSRGKVVLDGQPVDGSKPEYVASHGMRLVLEGHRVFPELTVSDNLRLAQYTINGPPSYEARKEAALELFPILRERINQHASDLSGGQQQLLAIAQAVMGNPKVLLCDEPSLGIAQKLIPEILSALKSLAEQGCAVLVVEQAVDQALEYADRVLVLDRGQIVLHGSGDDYREDDSRIKEIILGRTEVNQ